MLKAMEDKTKKKKAKEVVEKENEVLEEDIAEREHLETKPIAKTKPSKDALLIKIDEKIRCKINHSGELQELSKLGHLGIHNLGEVDRIFDIDVGFENTGELSGLDERLYISEIDSQKIWEKNYTILGTEATDLEVFLSEKIDVISDNTEQSTVLTYGKEEEVELSIKLEFQNECDSVIVEKKIPSHFKKPKAVSKTKGKTKIKNDVLVWSFEDVHKGNIVECSLVGKIDVVNKDPYSTGEIKASYSGSGEGKTKLKVVGADGYVRCKTYVESDEKEDMPELWENKFIVENNSEFPIEIREIKVMDKETDFINISFEEGEYILPSKESWKSEIWEKKSSDIPLFKKVVRYTVKPEITNKSSGIIEMSDRTLLVARAMGTKIYSNTQFHSHKVSPVTIETKISNTGSISFENLVINDELQPYFEAPSKEKIALWFKENEFTNEVAVDPANYSISIEEKEIDTIRKLVCNVKQKLEPQNVVVLKLKTEVKSPPANLTFLPEPEAIATLGEQASEFNIPIEDGLYNSQIEHVRRKHTWYKEVIPKSEQGIYLIVLYFKNRSNTELSKLKLQDFIPRGFSLYKDDTKFKSVKIGSENGGAIREWTIKKLNAEEDVEINYLIEGKQKYSGKDMFVSY